jgi:hypothetical protein
MYTLSTTAEEPSEEQENMKAEDTYETTKENENPSQTYFLIAPIYFKTLKFGPIMLQALSLALKSRFYAGAGGSELASHP